MEPPNELEDNHIMNSHVHIGLYDALAKRSQRGNGAGGSR